MKVTPIPLFEDNYIWCVDAAKGLVVVDPGDDQPVIDFLEKTGQKIAAILLTHQHWDHVSGAKSLCNKFSVNSYGPAGLRCVTNPVIEGDEIDLGIKFKVMAIPGHTLNHLGYIAEGCLFSGDTLFASGCGRLFEGTPEMMYNSLMKLAALPESTLVYCTHEYTSTNLKFAQLIEPTNQAIMDRIAFVQNLRSKGHPSVPTSIKLEMATNPFLRCAEQEVIESAKEYLGRLPRSNEETFAAIRELRNRF